MVGEVRRGIVGSALAREALGRSTEKQCPGPSGWASRLTCFVPIGGNVRFRPYRYTSLCEPTSTGIMVFPLIRNSMVMRYERLMDTE